jgi:hypothetical protein
MGKLLLLEEDSSKIKSNFSTLYLVNGATEPCKVFPYNVTQAIARPQNYGRPMLLCLEMGFFFFLFLCFSTFCLCLL